MSLSAKDMDAIPRKVREAFTESGEQRGQRRRDLLSYWSPEEDAFEEGLTDGFILAFDAVWMAATKKWREGSR